MIYWRSWFIFSTLCAKFSLSASLKCPKVARLRLICCWNNSSYSSSVAFGSCLLFVWEIVGLKISETALDSMDLFWLNRPFPKLLCSIIFLVCFFFLASFRTNDLRICVSWELSSESSPCDKELSRKGTSLGMYWPLSFFLSMSNFFLVFGLSIWDHLSLKPP